MGVNAPIAEFLGNEDSEKPRKEEKRTGQPGRFAVILETASQLPRDQQDKISAALGLPSRTTPTAEALSEDKSNCSFAGPAPASTPANHHSVISIPGRWGSSRCTPLAAIRIRT